MPMSQVTNPVLSIGRPAPAKAASPDATLVIAFDQTKPLLKAFASAGVDTKKLYFVAGLSNRFERM